MPERAEIPGRKLNVEGESLLLIFIAGVRAACWISSHKIDYPRGHIPVAVVKTSPSLSW